MTHIVKYNLLKIVSFCIVITLYSCNDFLDVESNHAASENEHWNKIGDVRASLMGIYGLTRAALSENNTHWLCGDIRMGDFTVYNRVDLQSVKDNDFTRSSLSEVTNWRRFYAAINAAAVFIEKAGQVVEKDKSYSEDNLRYDIAQARALRAFVYFYMVRLWGDVPLITESYDNGSFPIMKRTAAQTVLSYARGELLEVIPNLPYLYGTSTNLYYGNDNSYWRGMLLNKLSAYALLAHIAAWEGNYANTEVYSAFVLDNLDQIYAVQMTTSMLSSATGLFGVLPSVSAGSRIIGFPSYYDYSEATYTGHLEELTLASPLVQKAYPDIYIAKDKLFSVFDDLEDARFGLDTVTFQYSTCYINDMNAEYPLFSKMKIIQSGEAANGAYAVFGSSLIFTRMEELTLLRAEAAVALNRPLEGLQYLNDIRYSRGLRKLSFILDLARNNQLLMEAIFAERRRELMGEGWYWYDSIRRQKLLMDDPDFIDLIDRGGIYLPIDKEIISANPLIEQNDYWK